MTESYASAGVDIGAGNRAVQLIKSHVRSTHNPAVLGGVGFFSALYQLKGYKEPVLASSADGVGTKLKIAVLLDKYDSVGVDIVNHCVNDILTCGAHPLFFLDYLAARKIVPEKVESLVKGMAEACRKAECALIGGETAEMPGIYAGDDFDLAGFIVGAVEKDAVIDGSRVREGDAIIGLPSSGLHTNGYSLVRKVFGVENDAAPLQVFYPEIGRTLGEELLEPHRCYYPMLRPFLPIIKGMAHITGGGLIENVPRVLPEGLAARFNKVSWHVPPVFWLIKGKGHVDETEMYRVFNMGVGMALIVAPEDVGKLEALPGPVKIGEVVKQSRAVRVLIQ